jgi:glycosyltransferase involved in cell wall biosynthesis
MVIAFSNLFGHHYEGGATWLEACLLGLGALDRPPTCLIAGAAPEDLPAALAAAGHVRAVPFGPAPMDLRSRLARSPFGPRLRLDAVDPALRAFVTAHRPDLWISHGAQTGLPKDVARLVCFPDFQHRHLPQMFDPADVAGREAQWRWLTEQADGIIASSQTVIDDALATDPQMRERVFACPPPPALSAVDLALDPAAVAADYHLPDDYLIVSNQLYRHKNHELVVAALAARCARGDSVPVVAFTGRPLEPRDPQYVANLLRGIQRAGLHASCRFLGVVPRAEQVALVRGARAAIQPSRFEGRGAISEETAMLGTPLLCSDIPVHRELAIPGAQLFDVDDPRGLAALLDAPRTTPLRRPSDVLADLREKTRERGELLLAAAESAAHHRQNR